MSLSLSNILTRGPLDIGGNGMMWLSYFSPYCRMFEFVAGCLAAALYLKLRETLIRMMALLMDPLVVEGRSLAVTVR